MPKTKSIHRNANKRVKRGAKHSARKMKGGGDWLGDLLGENKGNFGDKERFSVDSNGESEEDKKSNNGGIITGTILLIACVVVGGIVLSKKH